MSGIDILHGGNAVAALKEADAFAHQYSRTVMNLTPIDPGNRIQLPTDWTLALGLRGLVALERLGDGILVRPCPPTSWEEIFADKLVIGSAPITPEEDAVEVTGDDFLF